MEILRVTDLSKIYGSGKNAVHALKQANLRVEQGEFVAVVGTSGSGKSTFLNLIGGLDIVFRRRSIGFVFQNYSLMPVLNVYDNVVLTASLDRGAKISHAFIEELLRDLGFWEKRMKYPCELSGGQQQCAAIARALENLSAVILADEPTGNVDSKTATDVMALLKSSAQIQPDGNHGDASDVLAQSCDRIVRIEDGILKEAD